MKINKSKVLKGKGNKMIGYNFIVGKSEVDRGSLMAMQELDVTFVICPNCGWEGSIGKACNEWVTNGDWNSIHTFCLKCHFALERLEKK